MFYSQLKLYFNRYTNTNDALVNVCIDKKPDLKRFPRLEHTNKCDRIRCLCGANVRDNLLPLTISYTTVDSLLLRL
jgi:hypothetical protein